MLRKLTGVVIAVALLASSVQAAGWGNLKGQFVLKGGAPAARKIVADKDVAYCGKHDLVDESLVVGSDGGIQNIVVFLYPKRGTKVPVAPSYKKAEGQTVVVDNAGCRFSPHVSTYWTKQKLVLKNSDQVGHNVSVSTFTNSAINPLIPAGAALDIKTFKKTERLPVPTKCSIHPWMTGYLLIRDNPYMAVTDIDGKFEIKDIPAGKWDFQFWQESAGYVKNVTIAGKKTSWRRGRVSQTINDGSTVDLGKVSVDVSLFK